ncbi:MAG: sulfatase-like hydrolase/transferase [Thermoanaerobaculia bacterium]
MTLRSRAALALLLAAPFACRRGPSGGGVVSMGAPVVLVSIDTLRSDRLPFYGRTRLETPALSRLRGDAVLFERAYAAAPLTLPSHAALMTGSPAGAHGVLDNSGYALAAGVPTLAGLARRSGYETGGAVSSVVLAARSGISRGFDFWDDAVGAAPPGRPSSQAERPGAETAEILSRWIAGRRTKPFLAFLHLYEPHAPYAPPEPFASRWEDPYDGEIAAADAAVGAFLDGLKARGLYDGSLVIVLSDHGEGLGDHGEKEHGVFLYREAIQVPLLVKFPGGLLAGSSVVAPVSLTDVLPTVCAVVGLEGCPSRPASVSLIELARGRRAPDRRILSETFFPRARFGWSPLASLVDERWHFIEAPRPELFDVAGDAAERSDRAPLEAAALRSMRREIAARRSTFRTPSPVGAEEARRLASLGYVTVAPSTGSGTLPDPKDVIGTLAPLRDGMIALEDGRPADAAALLGPLLSAQPAVRDGWEIYAQALLALGRGREALDAARRMVALSSPGSADVLLAVAGVALQAGETAEAIRNAEAARELGDPDADVVLAAARLAAGELGKADEAARRALSSGRSRSRALLVLARVAAVGGEPERALALLRELEASLGSAGAEPPPGLHFARGDALARLGRTVEAERELREEVRLFPSRVEARAALAALFAATGSRAKALSEIRELVERVPGPDGAAAAARSLEAIEEPDAARSLRLRSATLYPADPRFRDRGPAG